MKPASHEREKPRVTAWLADGGVRAHHVDNRADNVRDVRRINIWDIWIRTVFGILHGLVEWRRDLDRDRFNALVAIGVDLNGITRDRNTGGEFETWVWLRNPVGGWGGDGLILRGWICRIEGKRREGWE
jgi:hypothetical protein